MAVECYAPERAVTNDDLAKLVDTSDEWIYSRTGIRSRHVSTGENTSQMCIKVAERLLEKTGVKPEELDLIIVATITPDFATPSTACLVQGAIGADNAAAFDVSAACSGFIYSLSIADKFIKAGEYKKALVIGAETLSKYVDWHDRTTCVLFGDGAGGAIVEAREQGGIIADVLHAKGSDGMKLTGCEKKVRNFLSSPEPDRHYFLMDGKAIFNFATRVIPQSINIITQKSGVSLEDVKYIVPHQANYRIIEFAARKLKLPIEKFYINIDRYGNTSAASIAIALGEMSNEGLLQRGDKVILTGFGAGLTWGSMLIEW